MPPLSPCPKTPGLGEAQVGLGNTLGQHGNKCWDIKVQTMSPGESTPEI